MSVRRLARLPPVLVFVACGSCLPLHSSARDVIGQWQVECEDGKEIVELRPDGHYVYTIESPHRHVKIDGTWTIQPANERLESAHVLLQKAPLTCEKDTALYDHALQPVWEWGHTELSFNPDLGGFRRVK